MKTISRGVYFLANDAIFDLAIAFLNSFRKHNPNIPLCLIPYNADFSRLKGLQNIYKFSIYSNSEALNLCDEISVRFHNHIAGQYRKLVMWHGEFDEFIYIDTDTVVLGNVGFVFNFIFDYGFVTSHSNIHMILKFVWKKSIYKTGKLQREQIEYATNTGFIASKTGVLTLAGIKNKTEQAIELLPHMVLFCMEQPFINYLIVTSGYRYTSMYVLWKAGSCPEALECWAGAIGKRLKDGQIITGSKKPKVLLMHWAGKWQVTSIDKAIFFTLVALGLKKKSDVPRIRYFMPYKKLWKYYQTQQGPAA